MCVWTNKREVHKNSQIYACSRGEENMAYNKFFKLFSNNLNLLSKIVILEFFEYFVTLIVIKYGEVLKN